jgi:DNA-binding transcriptional LysR family regulator
VIVAAPGHHLAERKRISMETLLREPFVVREKGSDTWFSMEAGFGEHLRDLNIAMEIKSTETIKQAIIAGMGIGFLSAHTIGQELKTGSLVVLPVQGFPLMLDWYVVHRNDKRLPPVARAFKDFLLSEGAEMIEKLIPMPKLPRA